MIYKLKSTAAILMSAIMYNVNGFASESHNHGGRNRDNAQQRGHGNSFNGGDARQRGRRSNSSNNCGSNFNIILNNCRFLSTADNHTCSLGRHRPQFQHQNPIESDSSSEYTESDSSSECSESDSSDDQNHNGSGPDQNPDENGLDQNPDENGPDQNQDDGSEAIDQQRSLTGITLTPEQFNTLVTLIRNQYAHPVN